jgi:hypothetical protein
MAFWSECTYKLTEKKLDIIWENCLNVLHLIYSKDLKTMKIRKEVQEYPNKYLGEAFTERLVGVAANIGTKFFTIFVIVVVDR